MADDIKIVIGVDSAPVDRAVRVMDNLEAEARDVERAFKKGLITEKQYNAETVRLTKSMDRLKTVAKGSAKDFRTFEKTVYGSGKAMRQKEIAMQQAGYQLQDFIVQVQAGTNPLIAFSQQGSQLAGFFAGPWGAAIGLGIAALGGLGTALLGAKGKTEDLYTELKNLIDYLGENRESTSSLIEMSFSGPLEQARQDALAVLGIFRKIDQEAARQSISKSLKEKIVEPLADIQDQIQARRTEKSLFRTGRLQFVLPESARDELKKQEQAVARINELFSLAAKGPVEDLGIKLNEAFVALEKSGFLTDQLKKDFRELMETSGLQLEVERRLAEEHKKKLDLEEKRLRAKKEGERAAKEELNRLVAEREAEEKRVSEAYQRDIENRFKGETELFTKQVKISDELQKKIDQRTKAEKARDDAYEKQNKSLEDQLNIAKVRLNFGQNEMHLLEKMQQLEKSKLRDYISENKLTEDQASNLKDQLEELQKQERLLLQIKLQEEARVERARVLNRLLEGASAAYKQTVSKRLGKDTLDPRGEERGPSNVLAMELGLDPFANDKDTETRPTLTTIEDTIKSYRRQMATEQALMSLTGQRRREEELFLELKYANQDADIKTSETRLRGLAQEMAAMEERSRVIEEARQQQEALADHISGSMEDAFMSIVDGTESVKDAFRLMASDIIKQLYRVLVVQQMVGSFDVATGEGSGIAGFIGGLLKRENGGPVSAGTPYLVGERGPELFVPSSNGNVMSNKETMSGTTVVQNINISTGVQQTVRTEIRQLMPQIAESAKAAVAEGKRRGGNYRRALA